MTFEIAFLILAVIFVFVFWFFAIKIANVLEDFFLKSMVFYMAKLKPQEFMEFWTILQGDSDAFDKLINDKFKRGGDR